MSTLSALAPSGSLSLPSSTTGSTGNAPPLTESGLISGLNTNSIIQGLLAVDQQQITDITQHETQVQQVQSIYQQIQTKLLTLQSDASQLGTSLDSVFAGRTATSSNSSLVTAAASSSATPGVYSLQVNSLASAQEIASQGFDSTDSKITHGTFQIQSGTAGAATITIDSSNDTLQGLADAINNSGAGVTASLVNDGSANQPFRLLLTADNTGTSNGIQITNNLAADNGGATQPVFNASYVGPANLGAGYTGTATPTANTGAGGYTGSANDTYTFTVLNGGTVGTDSNLQVSYTDLNGAHQGVLTLGTGDAGVNKAVDQGLQVQFAAGTLVAGQTFSVKTYVPGVQNATNASVTLGTGSGALTLASPTNQINNLLPGVTLQLAGAAPGQPVTLTVAADTNKAQQAIDSFVSDYNDLVQYVQSQSTLNSQSGTAGPLLGDTRAESILQQVQSVLENVVPGVNSSLNNLSAIGITTNSNGQLQVNDTKVSQALNGQLPGVSLNDVQKLFGLAGASTNPGITFLTGSDQTQASGTSPYTVQITQAATQASVTATNALAGSITIDNTNNTLALTLDGKAFSVTLATGTYTATSLASMLQNSINAATAQNGRQISVGLQGNQLTFTSNSYGSNSQVAVGNGSANAPLGLAGTETATGTDVAGDFLVNGKVEAATGNGQYLVGNGGNANTAALQVHVTLNPAQVGAGAQANLMVTRGFASSLASVLNNLTDPQTGRLKIINDGFNQQLTNLQQDQTRETTAMNTQQQQLQSEFAAMENTLAQLQAASSAVNSLYALLPTSSSSSSSSGSKTTF
jgi:flagellar hook-associated protein 2